MNKKTSAIAIALHACLSILIAGARVDAQTTEAWTNLAPAVAPSARYYHGMVFDAAHGNTVLFGGYDGTRRGDTWIWDGTNWSSLAVTAPPARIKHSMVYQSTLQQTILFGGANSAGARTNDTWQFNGSAWTQVSTAHQPPVRDSSAMAYDSQRQRVVLFGGFKGGNPQSLGDTWEFDGTDWTQITPVHSPSARNGHAMVYDPIRGVTVLFGGFDSARENDTWTWNGIDWTQVTAASHPTVRNLHSLAFDPVGSRVLLFGGLESGSTYKNDTWQWDGTNWSQLQPGTPPLERCAHSAVFDVARSRMILFGGNGGSGAIEFFGDTQGYFQPDPPTPTNTPTETATSGPTAEPTVTPTATPVPPTSTPVDTATPVPTAVATNTTTPTLTPSASPSVTPTVTSSATATSTATPSATNSATSTATPIPTNSPTASATATHTSTVTPSSTATAAVSASATPSITPTTVPFTPTATATQTITATATETPAVTPVGTATPAVSTPIATATETAAATATPDNSTNQSESVQISGVVLSAGYGLPGVFVSAGFLGSQVTDDHGQFAFEIARGESYMLALSRTGAVLLPSSHAGIATVDEHISIDAYTNQLYASECSARDVTAAKLALNTAVLNLYAYIPHTTQSRRITQTVLNQIFAIPEVFYSCPKSDSCIQAEIKRALSVLRQSISRLSKSCGTVMSTMLKKGAKKGSPALVQIRAALRTLQRGTGKFPSSTYLCR